MDSPEAVPANLAPVNLAPLNPCFAVNFSRIVDGVTLATEIHSGTAVKAGQGFIVIAVDSSETIDDVPQSKITGSSSIEKQAIESHLLRWPGFAFRSHLKRRESGPNGLHLTFKLQDPQDRLALDALVAAQRKIHHIEICNTMDVESSDRDNGLAQVRFMPMALPELAQDDISAATTFLNREFSAPLLITGMTGGVERGRDINLNLARAAKEADIPMGVGSQRLALDDPRLTSIFRVKDEVPGVFLIGNIGVAQLLNNQSAASAYELCCRAIDMISADALAIHVNVLQEAIQPEGDRNFSGALDRIAHIAAKLPVPVIVKEVGCGLDPGTSLKLAQTGVSAIDVGGRGGTSWGWIEGLRARDPERLEFARSFRDWGLTTGEALRLTRNALQGRSAPQIIATGGIRNGIDVAKTLALGANIAGIGLPLFRAALRDSEAVTREIAWILRGLKTVMLCTGSKHISELPDKIYRHSASNIGSHEPYLRPADSGELRP